MTLGGQTFGNETGTGELKGKLRTVDVKPDHRGRYSIRLPASTAAMLTFPPSRSFTPARSLYRRIALISPASSPYSARARRWICSTSARQLDRHPHVAGEVDGQPQVLGHQPHRERLVVIAVVEHHAHIALEEHRVRRRPDQRRVQPIQRHPGANTDAQHLAHGYRLDEPEQVEQQLDRLAGAVPAEVDIRSGRPSPRAAAAPGRTPPSTRRHRSRRPALAPIDCPATGASSTSTPRNLAAATTRAPDGRRARAHVDRERPRLQGGNRPALSKPYRLDLRRRRQHRDQHLRTARAFGDRTGRPSPRLHPPRQRAGIEVVSSDVEPSLHEVTAHRTAHVPESDEPDPRDPGPLGGKRHHSATQVVFRCVYASSACSERSRPWPESFMPPNGVASDEASNVLIQTVPARRRRATR